MLNPLLVNGNFQSKSKKNGRMRVQIEDLVPPKPETPEVLPEALFGKMLYRERRRTERSKRPFVLILLESADSISGKEQEDRLNQILIALSMSTRETDLIGWHREGFSLGIIFTELGSSPNDNIADTLLDKVRRAIENTLPPDQNKWLKLSAHFYPEMSGERKPPATALCRESEKHDASRDFRLILKRVMDIAGSLVALIVLSPVFVVVALIVKLTSAGPVLFRQERIGQYGKRFTFLKFRSMYHHNDATIHREYTKRLILGSPDAKLKNGRQDAPFKLVADPRVTPVGKFLRKTSLDELPQFWNVLAGEMSLVGPRPPVPYEFANYDLWHCRRLFEAKPGITGLWQVRGRSRTSFDDMVRLDLKYASSWSLWLDIRILLETPKAVLLGAGAC